MFLIESFTFQSYDEVPMEPATCTNDTIKYTYEMAERKKRIEDAFAAKGYKPENMQWWDNSDGELYYGAKPTGKGIRFPKAYIKVTHIKEL